MKIFTSKELLKKSISNVVNLAFVPTLGGLHNGHISLIRIAKRRSKKVLVSIYVNPTQFNHKIDLESYPSNPDGDMILLDSFSDQIIFYTPDHKDLYPGKIKSK